MTRGALSGAWWEARPRSVVAEGLRKASGEIASPTEAPPGMAHYQTDPIGFCVHELGIRRETLVWSSLPEYEGHRWDGTPDPFVAWFQALVEWKDVGIESATGTGKSFGLALTKLWFMAAWQGARCFDFAAKKEQLEEYSWMELGKLWPRFKVLFPSAHKNALKIRMDGRIREGDLSGWGAFGQGVKVGAESEIAAGAAGMHAAHMLISVEEAQEFAHAASAGLENTCTAPHNLRQYVGNPDAQDDALHQMCILPDTVAIRMSAYDHPNVVVNNVRDPEWKDLKNDVMIVPGAVSRTSIGRRMRRYRSVEHPHFMSRVRGFSPPEHRDALVRQTWIDRAVKRWETGELRYGLPALGVDVARSEAGDKAAIAEGVGAHCNEVPAFPCPDVHALGVRVAAMMATRDISELHVGVDVGGGYGGGTVDALKSLGLFVQPVNPGGKAMARLDETELEEHDAAVREEVLYRNVRAQMAWRLALDLQLDRIALPPDEELHEELRSMRWKPVLGKIQVEEKPDIAERLGRSPDKADAVMIWNWVRHRFHEEEEEDFSAFSPEGLRAQLEQRRITDAPPPRPGGANPTLIERID